MRQVLFLSVAMAVASASAAVPTATVNSSVQDGRRRLQVNWTLSGAPGYVTLDVLTNGVSVGGVALNSVSGDVNGFFTPGDYAFTWAPTHSGVERRGFADGEVRVVLTAHDRSDAPPWCVVDLKTGVLRYYGAESLLPHGPLRRSGTAAELLADPYRTTLLVLRRIPALGLPFQVGESGTASAYRAVLSHDFYMAVYEMTQRQHEMLTGETSSRDTAKELSPVKPVDTVNRFSTLRGAGWPDGGHAAVEAGSPIAELRTLTGAAFDLPTQAEWEFAARGARTTARDDGSTDAEVGALAWYEGNADGETHPVGIKEPNLFGLYDMYGNVCEWVLDWRDGQYGVTERTAPAIDPVGGAASEGGGHVRKGGSYLLSAAEAAATTVISGNYDNYKYHSGYRLCLPVGGAETEAPEGLGVHQDAASKIVTVRYALDEEAIVTLDVLTNGVSIGAANIRYAWGAVNRLLPAGTHELRWPAAKSWPGHGELGGFTARIVTWPRTSPPDYAVTALGPGMKGHTAYFADVDQIPLGITNALYKSEMLALRRVHAAGRVWTVGSPTFESGRSASFERAHRVAFSRDYYLGVYETTQRQYQRVLGLADEKVPSFEARYGTRADWAFLPMNSNAQYYASTALRGTTAWPGGGHGAVTASSPIGRFRSQTGFALDLPTEAEWEVACRAGTQGPWSCAKEELEDFAWFAPNSGGELHEVGTRRPNAWGFYDMMGNVAEFCLQWIDRAGDSYGLTEEELTGVTLDPTGASEAACTTPSRFGRGGNFVSAANGSGLRVASRTNFGNNGTRYMGFRLCAPAEAPAAAQ